MRINYITQGEYSVGTHPKTVISTLLGSCISCCLWDPTSAIGGMNHILLPNRHLNSEVLPRSGVNEMEILINALTKRGAMRCALKAKVFGGAQMVEGLSDIGAQNARFVLSFLNNEQIPIVTQCVGGKKARNLKFWPTTGRVLQKSTDTQIRTIDTPSTPHVECKIEMFDEN